MLAHWISQVSSDLTDKYTKFSPESLANSVSFDQNNLTTGSVLAIIGWDADASTLVRNTLYRFRDCAQYININDLGDFKKQNYDFIIPALHELLDTKIPWILIGGREPLFDLQLKIYENRQKSYSAVGIHESHPYAGYLDSYEALKLQHLHCVAHQSHLPSSVAESADAYSDMLELHRLGQLKRNMENIEPIMRSGDFIDMHLSSLRKTDLPAQTGLSTSGLTLDDACQLMRYAGFNDRLRSLSISGWDPWEKGSEDSANAIAQLIWYYIEGMERSYPSRERKEEHLTEFLVHLDANDTYLSFYKDERFGTWWVRLKSVMNGDHGPLMPCSYNDYHAACQNMLSDRIFRLVQKA